MEYERRKHDNKKIVLKYLKNEVKYLRTKFEIESEIIGISSKDIYDFQNKDNILCSAIKYFEPSYDDSYDKPILSNKQIDKMVQNMRTI